MQEDLKLVEKNLEKWLEENDPRDFVRDEDMIYFNVLGYDDETMEVGIYLCSEITRPQNYTPICRFPNGQDRSNADYKEDFDDFVSSEYQLAEAIRNTFEEGSNKYYTLCNIYTMRVLEILVGFTADRLVRRKYENKLHQAERLISVEVRRRNTRQRLR